MNDMAVASSGGAIRQSVPPVSAETAERLWRQFAELGRIHARRAREAERLSVESFERAGAYRELVPAERLAQLDAERMAQARAGA